MTLPTHTAQRLSDRLLFLLIFAAFVAWFAAMGFEARFAAPAWGPLGQALGATLILACMWIAWRTFRENSFATPDVRVQAERGQRVISTGPYAVVRHPLYAGAVLWMVGAPLLLGSRWGFIGAAVLIALMAQRALEEEKVLAEGLAGYGDYRRKVRFRFVPGVW
jgi:protein-S-isoprenylcysteine O-methyltransferase Ste14